MDNYIKVMPFGLVLIISLKCVFVGTTFPDVALLGVLSGLGCYLSLNVSNKKVKKIEDKFLDLEDKFNVKSKELDDLKNHLSGLKLASVVRSSAGKF